MQSQASFQCPILPHSLLITAHGSPHSPQSSHEQGTQETRHPGCLVCHHPKEQAHSNNYGLNSKPHPHLPAPLPYSFQSTSHTFCPVTTTRKLSLPFRNASRPNGHVALFMPSFNLTSRTFLQEEMTHCCKPMLDW